ncbi:MAG: winged helix-turn-helix transcriptional regulator [Eggerthellaceae bacterium]
MSSQIFEEHRARNIMAKQDLPPCPVEVCVSLIGNKWRPLILRDLLEREPLRFKELQRSVGEVSQKVLTSNLRELEDAGIVVRRVYPEVPPRVEYSLTEEGRSLGPVIDCMKAWGENYQARVAQGLVKGTLG